MRTGRYTHQLLEDTGEITVNIPMSEPAGNILDYCGTNSGRDVGKVKKLDLTLEEGCKVKPPGIKELPLTLECKIIYRQLQDSAAMPPQFRDEFYPQDVPSTDPSANKDYHTVFCGEIVDCYVIK